MMRHRLDCLVKVVVGTAIVGQLAFAATAQAAGDSAKGKETATAWCARCHVIGTFNKYGGINSTPSFFIMARKPEVYSAKLLTFQERRPHAALHFDVSEQDLEDILSYVGTLKPE
ncbi:MAG: cytochrome c [Kiloniellales bacterium]|nr:cytochrome c [Kiloniellales bacterium]